MIERSEVEAGQTEPASQRFTARDPRDELPTSGKDSTYEDASVKGL